MQPLLPMYVYVYVLPQVKYSLCAYPIFSRLSSFLRAYTWETTINVMTSGRQAPISVGVHSVFGAFYVADSSVSKKDFSIARRVKRTSWKISPWKYSHHATKLPNKQKLIRSFFHHHQQQQHVTIFF